MEMRPRSQVMRGDVMHSSVAFPGDFSHVGDKSEPLGREQ